MINSKEHWNSIYATKRPNEVSWTQEVPSASMKFIKSFNLPKSAAIIDIGGGESNLAKYLLEEGFTNITVLDISEQALSKAKHRLGADAAKVHWIISDINEFSPNLRYDLWHDRAMFHFLTTEEQITRYCLTAKNAVKPNGYLTIGTFSTDGPEKCSGLTVQRYNEESLTSVLRNGFKKLTCVTEDHITPFNTKQNFLFCGFQRSQQ
jgi:2-polyprenyl-3-methyl-5-hydroxy-6-metoxy-1,4-benzoquinol methylase